MCVPAAIFMKPWILNANSNKLLQKSRSEFHYFKMKMWTWAKWKQDCPTVWVYLFAIIDKQNKIQEKEKVVSKPLTVFEKLSRIVSISDTKTWKGNKHISTISFSLFAYQVVWFQQNYSSLYGFSELNSMFKITAFLLSQFHFIKQKASNWALKDLGVQRFRTDLGSSGMRGKGGGLSLCVGNLGSEHIKHGHIAKHTWDKNSPLAREIQSSAFKANSTRLALQWY